MDEEPNVILTIWSHSHAPPLRPPADISFDLRRVPNPPKHIRDSYDGRSKRLREHLLHDATFTSLLDSAMQEILQVAKEEGGGASAGASKLVAQPEETYLGPEGETVASSRDLSSSPATATSTRDTFDGNDCHESESGASDDGDATQGQTHSSPAKGQVVDYDSDQEQPNPQSGELEATESESGFSSTSSLQILRISCFCERGRHRSVAFAEELDRMQWPRAWDVTVQHRDVVEGQGSNKSNKKRSRQSGREVAHEGGQRRLAFGFGPDEDEL